MVQDRHDETVHCAAVPTRASRLYQHRLAAILLAAATAGAVLVSGDSPAQAAIVATVPMGDAGGYVVLGAETVTNTGPSTLYGDLGVSPGTSITGFYPPGQVLPPGDAAPHSADAHAGNAQADLTTAYLNAKGRPFTATTTADLGGKTLTPGVWIGPDKGALLLNGTLILDAENNPDAVFIIQTDSTLTTGTASGVSLISGAKECNVFWQIGSSATLGTYSDFTGTILALTAVTVTTGVVVHGRALATTAAVTLDTNTFTLPTCADTTTTTSGGGGSAVTTTTSGGGGSAVTTTTPGGGGTNNGSTTTTPGPDSDTAFRRPSAPSVMPSGSIGPGVPGVVGAPRTGAAPVPVGGTTGLPVLLVLLLGVGGVVTISVVRSRRTDATPPAAR